MASRFMIGGLDKTAWIAGTPSPAPTIDWPLNERATARFTCLPGFIPPIQAPVEIYAEDDTLVFAGLVLPTGRRIRGVVPSAGTQNCEVECGDLSTYLDWAYTADVFQYLTDVSLHTVLTDLCDDYLTPRFGITLDPAQADPGPMLLAGETTPAVSWPTRRISDCLRDLSERTSYVWRISPLGVLSMYIAGTTPAPDPIETADPHCRVIAWQDNASNTAIPTDVVVLWGPPGTVEGVHWWLAQDPPPAPIEHSWVAEVWWTPTGHIVMGGVNYWLRTADGHPPFIPGGPYDWDYATATLSQGWAPDIAPGQSIRMYYTITYPIAARATTGGTPTIEIVVNRPDILDATVARDAAAALLASIGTGAMDILVTTLEHGYWPGQLLTVDMALPAGTSPPAWAWDTTAIIMGVSAELVSPAVWQYQITATYAGFAGSLLDQWRALLRRGGGSGGSSTTGPVGGTAPPPGPAYFGGSRFHAVQVPAP
jgi:hypothetical protein